MQSCNTLGQFTKGERERERDIYIYIHTHTPVVSSCTVAPSGSIRFCAEATCREESPNHHQWSNFTWFHHGSYHITILPQVHRAPETQLSFPCRGQGSKVTGTFCHEECEARHLDPIERTRWDEAAGFHYPAKPLGGDHRDLVDGCGPVGSLICLMMLMFVGEIPPADPTAQCFNGRWKHANFGICHDRAGSMKAAATVVKDRFRVAGFFGIEEVSNRVA